MAALPPVPQPPACANCITSIQSNGAPAVQSASSLVRASDGKTRIDMPNTSVIANPAAQQAILLDHVNKEAHILPLQPQMPGMPQAPGMPQMPQLPGMPQAPQIAVQDLGKNFIEGHPVDGKRYTMQLPAPPQAPQMPAPPQMPQVPGMPQAKMPQAPQAPQMPPPPTISEVWSSTALKMPVLTKITTPGGVQTTYCKPAPMPEPNPALFQIPPGYKVVVPKVQAPQIAVPKAPIPKL